MTSSNWSIPLHRWNVPPSAPVMLPHSLPVLFPASVSLASLPVFPVFFDHLQHRLHRSLNYTWFCLVLCSRYTFQSRLKSVERCCLTPATVLGYFKREREM